ncbi:MAG: LacI family transcriptional regulator [Phycisphaerae bacterium]|nr:LacI family transcriptional regulator [Phycisphaerae bacterium]
MATVNEIAQEVGISKSSVYQILANPEHPRYSPATRQRVKKQAVKMGYKPNLLAKGLAEGKTNTIGFVACSVSCEAGRKKLVKLHDLVNDRGYSFSFFMMKAGSVENEIAAIDEMRARGMDGLVISTQMSQVGKEANRHFFRLNEQGYPYVLFDSGRNLSDFGGYCVTLDRVEAGRMAVEHLCELGHRRIGFIGPQTGEDYRQKEQGYALAMQSHGLGLRKITIPDMSADYKFGYQGVMENIEAIRELTALSCYSDKIAVGAIRALKELGISVPGQIAVVGFDNDDMGEMMTPSLTTIAPPVDQLVQTTVDLLFERIQSYNRPMSRHIEIKPELIIRESTGPVRPGKKL